MQNSQGPQAWAVGAHWSLGISALAEVSSYTSLGWTDIVSHIPGKQNSGLAETHHRIDQTALVSCFCGTGLGPRVWAVGTHLFLRNEIITVLFPVPHTLHPTMLQKRAILCQSQVLAATVPGLAEAQMLTITTNPGSRVTTTRWLMPCNPSCPSGQVAKSQSYLAPWA